MTQANSKLGGAKRKFKLSKFQIGLVVIIALLVAQYFVITVAMPLMRGDGTGSFTGAEKEAAIKAANNIKGHLQIDHKILSKVHVEQVYATTEAEKEKYCTGIGSISSNGSSDPTYYTVVMSVRDLFSYAGPTTETIYGCFKLL